MSVPPPIPPTAKPLVAAKQTSFAIRLLGFLLFVPALLVGLFTLWIPTVRLVQLATFGGIGNAPEPNWLNDIGFTIAIAGARFAAGLAAIAAGLAAAFLGPFGRNFFRTIFLIPVLLLGPTSFGLSCLLLGLTLGIPQNGHDVLTLLAEGSLAFTMLLLAAVWFFPATRPDGAIKKSKVGVKVVLAIFLSIAAIATGLQAFALPSTVNFMAGVLGAQSVAVRILNQGFLFNERGAAQVDAFLLLGLALLGLVGSVLLVATNLRLDFHRFVAGKRSAGWWIGLILGLGCCLALAAIVVTFFAGFQLYTPKLQHSPPEPNGSTFEPLLDALGNLVLPVSIWVCLGSFVSYLAALGIGALRPLGRYSEWLLLPFFPYLFVSVVTLSPALNDLLGPMHWFGSPLSLLQPLLIFVPQLILLTLFFKGQVYRRGQANPRPDFFRSVLLPSIPVTLTFAVVSALMSVRDSYWYMSAITRLKSPVLLYFESFENSNVYLFCYYPLAVSIGTLILLFPILGLLQIFVVDRLQIQTGGD